MKELCLSFDDITLVPQYSSLRSRKEADTKVELFDLSVNAPIIPSNMETISGIHMCNILYKNGFIGALHRFWSINENKIAYSEIRRLGSECFVSVGVKEEERQRAQELYSVGARYFIIDVAHGHSIYLKEMLLWMKEKFSDIKIIAGNVATADGVMDLESWGADAIKIGVGMGANCITRKVTGHGIPSATCILECARVAKVPLIQDGGCRDSGDIAKSLALGASFVMCGSLFAGAIETPGDIQLIEGKKYKYHRGSSSYKKNQIAVEGVESYVLLKDSCVEIMNQLIYGLQSAMSYSNSKTIHEFRLNAEWQQQTHSSELEGRPHIGNKGIIL